MSIRSHLCSAFSQSLCGARSFMRGRGMRIRWMSGEACGCYRLIGACGVRLRCEVRVLFRCCK